MLLPTWEALPDAIRTPALAYVQAHWRTLKDHRQLTSMLADTCFVTTGRQAASSLVFALVAFAGDPLAWLPFDALLGACSAGRYGRKP